ncbi:hypothetical protein COOONC_22208, partial [Cooperia oncophora]
MRRHMDPDIRLCALYEFKLRHSYRVACDNLIRAYGADAVSIHTVKKWFRRFRAGNENTNHTPPSSVVNDVELKRMMDENPDMAMRDLARYFGVTYQTIKTHITSISEGKFRKYAGDKPNPYRKRKKLSSARNDDIDS